MRLPRRFNVISIFPRMSTILFIAIFLGAIGIGPRMMNMDGDLGRHLVIGNYILTTGSIPRSDIFSFSMEGQPLTPHEWLSEVLFALAYKALNFDGVVLLSALILGVTIWLLFRELLRKGAYLLVAMTFVILAAAATSIHWLTRPHLFTFLMVILWTGQLERLRIGQSKKWWLLPIIMLFWVNLHGAFIAGIVILFIYGAGFLFERFFIKDDGTGQSNKGYERYLAAGGIAAGAATFINPSGWHVWSTSLGFVGNAYLVNHTNEYLSPDFHQASTWPFLVMILLSLVIIGLARTRIPPAHLFMAAGWTVMGLYSARNIPIYALAVAPILVQAVDSWLEAQSSFQGFIGLNQRLSSLEGFRRYFSWAIPVVILVFFLFSKGINLDLSQKGNNFDPAQFPVAAVDWVQANHPGDRVFNYFPWGGYLLFRLWPNQKVFIDGQTDFYGEKLTRQYEQVIDLESGWQDVLNEYHIDWMLLPVNSGLARAIVEDSTWHIVYQDTTSVVIKHE